MITQWFISRALDWRTYAVLALFAVMFTVGYKLHQHGYAAGMAQGNAIHTGDQKTIADLNAKISESNDLYNRELLANSQQQQVWLSKYQEAESHAGQLQTAINAATATAAANVASLRQSLTDADARLSSSTSSQAPDSAAAEYAVTAGTVLNECVGSYQELAAKADGHAIDAQRLENSWPQ